MSIDRQILQSIVADKNRLIFGANIPQKYLSDALGRRGGTADALDPLHILNDQKSYIKGDTRHAASI